MINLAGLGKERKYAGRVLNAYQEHDNCHPVSFDSCRVDESLFSIA